MKVKSSIFYAFLLISSIMIVILISNHLLNLQKESFAVYPYFIFKGLEFVPIGIILGLPTLMNKRRQSGKWTFNYTSFLLLGIPSLILTLFPITHFYILPFPSTIAVPLLNTGLYSVFGLVFGYSCITNLNKVVDNHWKPSSLLCFFYPLIICEKCSQTIWGVVK